MKCFLRFKMYIITLLLILFVLELVWSNSAHAVNSIVYKNSGDKSSTTKIIIDMSKLRFGIVNISYSSDSEKKVKLLIEKERTRYTYNLKKDGSTEAFSLQLGDGFYKISILENKQDNIYKYIHSDTYKIDIVNEKSVYLNSIQNVNWEKAVKVISKARDLTKNQITNEKKIIAIYNYITQNFKYDYGKLKLLHSDYLPEIENMLTSKKGICYDFASLFAGMLRSIGIPAKLVMGYSDKVKNYHAWNEVYLNNTGKWVVIDTCYDLQSLSKNLKTDIYKPNTEFKKLKEY